VADAILAAVEVAAGVPDPDEPAGFADDEPGSFQFGAPFRFEVETPGLAPPDPPADPLRTSVAFKSNNGFGFFPEDAPGDVLSFGLPPELSFLSAILLNP
jgi:hypothetical protein